MSLSPRLAKIAALCFMTSGIVAMIGQARSTSMATVPTPPTAEQTAYFETKVRPILATNCLPCHSKASHMGALALDSQAGFLKGGDSGPSVVPGDPDKSLLIQAVRQSGSLKMPQGGKLAVKDISELEAWVKLGAPWPDDPVKALATAAPLWSLQPVAFPTPPKVKFKSWVNNPIDSFVLAGLEAKGLKPAPVADRRTLIRRVTYDLTGLPPTFEEVDAFLKDRSPGAYEKVVDRLLASPHYGERWARHWLDVARYADTKGYVFNEDRNYYNAYTFRDWVIDAVNRDLPYDQFVEEQLAADLMPEVEHGDDKRPLAALGFLTVGRRFLNSQPDIVDDRIDVTMRGLEGFTVACARCHDHKFDPIPTQDYYSLYAVFNGSVDKPLPISDKSITDPWVKHNQEVEANQTALRDLITAQVKKLRDRKADPKQVDSLSAGVKQKLQALREDVLPEGDDLKVLSGAFEDGAQKSLQQLQERRDTLAKSAPASPEFAMGLEDRADAGDGVVFKRGNPATPGEKAPRRFLLALSEPGKERDHWTKGSGRLQLAKAIASKQNPLTARVFANRVWLHDFGAGIVRTPSDFGHQGEKPTNPQLLDFLASWFMSHNWSLKALNRLIVTSSAYCQASNVSPAVLNADPENRLWGRMNRKKLDYEEVHDSMAFGAEKLDLTKIGGKSVDLWQQPFPPRRTLYGFVERQNLPSIFRVFDFATPDATSPKRFQTTVPQQALFFMNSPFAVQEAQSLVQRPEIAKATSELQKIRRIYEVLFQRLPAPDEEQLASRYLGPQADRPVDSPASAWDYGYGRYDESTQRVDQFTSFAVFANGSYHPAEKIPDPVLGYVSINAQGGHPGRDPAHAAIRRWKALFSGTVSIQGVLAHGQTQGDGVRGRLISSRLGLLGEWRVHNSSTPTDLKSVLVKKGDTLDFVVDPLSSDAFDSFSWSPTVTTLDKASSWVASSDFGPRPGPPLTRLTLYAQALMMTNEFMFVD